jgi:hypothetical protein
MLQFGQELRVEAVRSGHKGRVLDFGDEKFVVREELYFYGGHQELYWFIRVALKTGEFSAIKKCRQCSKFFASYRRGARACSPKCNSEYHNNEGRRQGYFRTNYLLKKKKKLAEARKAKREKESRPEIIRKSGLTELALIRAGILEPL